MPAVSKSQFRFFKMLEKHPERAKEHGIKPSVAKEYTKENKGKHAYHRLKEKLGCK